MREIVLLPGSFCTAQVWAPQKGCLEASGFVVRVPQIDHLRDVDAMANEVLAAFPNMYGLAGLSLGGVVAQRVAAQQPPQLERLVLLSTFAHALGPAYAEETEQVVSRIRAGELEQLADWAAHGWTPKHRHHDAALLTALSEMGLHAGPEANINTMYAASNASDFRASLGQTRASTLIVCGEDDLYVTPVSYHREIAARISAAELVVLGGTGHVVTLEQPERVAELLLQWFCR